MDVSSGSLRPAEFGEYRAAEGNGEALEELSFWIVLSQEGQLKVKGWVMWEASWPACQSHLSCRCLTSTEDLCEKVNVMQCFPLREMGIFRH
jgi:hypothetical protein